MNDAYYEGAVEWVNGGQQNPEHLHCLREQRDYYLLGHLIVEFFNENLNLEDDDVEAAPDLDCVQHEGEGEGAEGRAVHALRQLGQHTHTAATWGMDRQYRHLLHNFAA